MNILRKISTAILSWVRGKAKINKYEIHWIDGTVEIIEGKSFGDACRRAYLSIGSISLVDYYKLVK